MTDDERARFPLGKPIRPQPKKPAEIREQVRPGVYRRDGKLETEIPTRGPMRAPDTPATPGETA